MSKNKLKVDFDLLKVEFHVVKVLLPRDLNRNWYGKRMHIEAVAITSSRGT